MKQNLVNSEDVFTKQYVPTEDLAVYVIVPNYMENPHIVKRTAEQILQTNAYADYKWLNFRIEAFILSDQSPINIAKVNRGLLYTAKDVIKRCYGDTPRMYHLVHKDKELEGIFMDYLGIKPPTGKGGNMFVASLAVSSHPKKNVALLFFDAENEQFAPDNVIALGAPLLSKNFYNGKIGLTKMAFDRYHMVGAKKYLGGRVNASVGLPLINMLVDKKIMPPIYYPLSGEVGILRDYWESINIPKSFGIEMGTLLQLLVKNVIPPERFLQVYVGMNMDQPLAEAKPKRVIYEKICAMTRDIITTFCNILNSDIKKQWKTKQEFMEAFRLHQQKSVTRWGREGLPITGNIEVNTLKERTTRVVEEVIEKFYEGAEEIYPDNPNNQILKPINKIREDMGLSQFIKFVHEIRSRMIEIK